MAGTGVLHPGLVPAETAQSLVFEGAGPLGVEKVRLEEASGRVLAEDLSSKRTQPPFPASAMDGYAVRHSDIAATPVTLRVTGQSAAGRPFDGTVGPGECVRIFTGAPVPDGADTVVIQENTRQGDGTVEILTGAVKGRNIRAEGLDFRKGDVLIQAGTVLEPQFLALAASMNHALVPVWRRPRVAILATGDELVMPGNEPGPGQIIASNTFAVEAIARNAGADTHNTGIALDTKQDLRERISREIDAGADLIVTTGGASVGDHDLVRPVLEELGFRFVFVKLAIRPGKPLIHARAEIGGRLVRVLGLAGNPVSSIIASHIFVAPLIRRLCGHPPESLEPVAARLAEPIPGNDERQDYMRAIAERLPDGSLSARAFATQDSSMLATLARANCLIVRPVRAPAAEAGDSVPVILLSRI